MLLRGGQGRFGWFLSVLLMGVYGLSFVEHLDAYLVNYSADFSNLPHHHLVQL